MDEKALSTDFKKRAIGDFISEGFNDDFFGFNVRKNLLNGGNDKSGLKESELAPSSSKTNFFHDRFFLRVQTFFDHFEGAKMYDAFMDNLWNAYTGTLAYLYRLFKPGQTFPLLFAHPFCRDAAGLRHHPGNFLPAEDGVFLPFPLGPDAHCRAGFVHEVDGLIRQTAPRQIPH